MRPDEEGIGVGDVGRSRVEFQQEPEKKKGYFPNVIQDFAYSWGDICGIGLFTIDYSPLKYYGGNPSYARFKISYALCKLGKWYEKFGGVSCFCAGSQLIVWDWRKFLPADTSSTNFQNAWFIVIKSIIN